MLEKARTERITRRYRCSQGATWLYLDLRDEGFDPRPAALQARIAVPDDNYTRGGGNGHAA